MVGVFVAPLRRQTVGAWWRWTYQRIGCRVVGVASKARHHLLSCGARRAAKSSGERRAWRETPQRWRNFSRARKHSLENKARRAIALASAASRSHPQHGDM